MSINNSVLIIFLIFIVASLFSGCTKDSFCNCLENTGSETTETRPMPEFIAIEMDNNVDIILKKGNEPMAKVTCGKNLIDGIRTEVREGTLYIYNRNKCNWLRDFKNKFTVEVTYTDLQLITTRGSGNLSCADTLRATRFQVESWNGTGTLDFTLNCGEVYFKLHTGPGDIFASGKATIMYVYTAGNGYVKVAGVESDYTYVTTKSTGDCEVSAKKELEVFLEYNGDVYYKGNPEVIRSEITGKGKLISF